MNYIYNLPVLEHKPQQFEEIISERIMIIFVCEGKSEKGYDKKKNYYFKFVLLYFFLLRIANLIHKYSYF